MSHLEKLELYQRVINELRPFEGEMLKQIKAFYRIGLTSLCVRMVVVR